MNPIERYMLECRLHVFVDATYLFYGKVPRYIWRVIADTQARLGYSWWEAHSRAMGWLK